MKKVLSILGILIVVAVMAIFGYVKYQNKETIVDLGNGWKSYHYNKTGITVKIPNNATTRKEHADTRWAYGAIFSKGLIQSTGAIKMIMFHVDENYKLAHKKDIEELRKSVGKGVVEKEYGIDKKKKYKEIYCETHIKNKIAFIEHLEDPLEEFNKRTKISRINVLIPGYKQRHSIGINMDLLYKQYPHLKDVPFEDRCEEYINIVKPYILEIDNF